MKKLIHEVVTLSLIISFLSNTLATVSHASGTAKKPTTKSSDKTVLPYKASNSYDMVPKANGTVSAIPAQKRQAPDTIVEKFLDMLGIKGATPTINTNRPTFSSLALDAEKAKLLAERNVNYSDLVSATQKQLNLGARQSDGSLVFNYKLEQPATRLSPTIVSNKQIAELIVNNNIQKTAKTSSPYYFPAQESEYVLKMTPEELAKNKAAYSDVRFEVAGREGNVHKVRIKNPHSKENLFVGFKVDKELIKKFSPLMVEDTLSNKFKEASIHAAQTFPMEALTFYTGIYFNTLLNLLIQYENDPAALDKLMHEFTSPEGNISFFAFMLGNRLFSSLVNIPLPKPGASLGKRMFLQSLGFLGMGVGSLASAFSHDVMTLTKTCALNMMKISEFDDEGKAKVQQECQSSYDSVVSSSNAQNYVVSFMNILGSAGVAGVVTKGIIAASGAAFRGATAATGAVAQMTTNPALGKASVVMEGLVLEMNTLKSEQAAMSLSKNLMKNGKATTASRLANWFGYVKNKPGNLARFGLSFGRLGWKIAGGIVIFLQADERLRPYTYHFHQQIMGSGADLDSYMKRLNVQSNFLNQNNWNKTICQAHDEQNQKNGFRSFYVDNQKDCDLMKKTEQIKEQSRLWRESILYKFMTAYSNWLMYVENYHSQWNMTYTFFDQFIAYADDAKLAEYDANRAERYNPLLHDDMFLGIQSSERIKSEDAIADYMTMEGELNFKGMNVARAQRVIDLLPLIGSKLKEIRSANYKHKDWKDVEEDLLKISTNITAYITLNARSKGGKLDRISAVKEHFSKLSLAAGELPTYEERSTLINTIDIIIKRFDDYASAYRINKKSVNSRDRSAIEAARLLSLYDKANFYKGLKQFLGNPKPAARGEAFVRIFDETLKANYTEEQIKNFSRLSGSVGKDILWLALCGQNFIGTGKVEDESSEYSVSTSSWGKNVNFKVPRLTEKLDLNICKGFDDIIPTRASTKKQSKMDYLMKNLSSILVTDMGSNFSGVWEESVLPKISKVYDKFDISYQILIRDQFKEKFIGEDMENIFAHKPQDAYKYIKRQPRNPKQGKITATGVIGQNVAQVYIDEMDIYLKMLNDIFTASLKQDVAIKFAGEMTEKNKNLFLEATKKRKDRFDTLQNHFRNGFVKMLLSYGQGNVEVEKDYAGLMLTYLQLNKSMGIVGDLKIEQKNVEEDGETNTKVVATVSRNPFAEMIYGEYLKKNKKDEIEKFVKSQEKLAGVSNAKTKEGFTDMYLTNSIDNAFVGKLRLRLETQPDMRHPFEEMKELLEAQGGAYGQDRNMSLPLIDNNMNVSKPAGAIMYTYSQDMMTNQFLGALGASKALDQLMEEAYFNVSILKAASIDNKYRKIEEDQLKKFKPNTMGMGGRGM